MPKITYKNLYSLTNDLISKRLQHIDVDALDRQLGHDSSSPRGFGESGNSAAVNAALLELIQAFLSATIPSLIILGLEVTATSPPSANVYVSAGKGSVNGELVELLEDIQIHIPFDIYTSVFYINLYQDMITVDKNEHPEKLKIAKIVVPEPGTTNKVKDRKTDPHPWDAYIVTYKTYHLYGDTDGNLEEDSIEFLRDAMSELLADNLIGNIRLSEDLKITNTAGTLELNSDSLKLYDRSENLLSKFNQTGVYFYDSDGIEIAKFSTTGAKVGNISITTNSIQSGNYIENVSGFRILDNGNAEFNDIRLRGTLYTSTISENIYIDEGVTFIGTIKLNADEKLVFDSDMGSDTYWTYNSSTQYLEGWVDGVKRIEL